MPLVRACIHVSGTRMRAVLGLHTAPPPGHALLAPQAALSRPPPLWASHHHDDDSSSSLNTSSAPPARSSSLSCSPAVELGRAWYASDVAQELRATQTRAMAAPAAGSLEAAFVAALRSLTGSKDSIGGCAELLLQAPSRLGPLVMQRGEELAAGGEVFVALLRLVYVLNDALFALHAAQQPTAAVTGLLPGLVALATRGAGDAERNKLFELFGFWQAKGVVDSATADALRSAAFSRPSAAHEVCGDTVCPAGVLPELVRRANRGVSGVRARGVCVFEPHN